MPASSGWRGISVPRTSIICGSGADIASNGWFSPKPSPLHYRSASAVSPSPEDAPATFAWTRCTRGDQDGVKGVYHINAVVEVTQWEVVGAVERISEAAKLEPLLEGLRNQFPFRILGFHSDNGSEFINHNVEALLNKLLIAQNQIRAAAFNDNGLVESKNGAVIRKHMGFDPVASAHAEAINVFYEKHFNPYLNFHRPCGVPELRKDKQGKTVRVYKWYATPWEILRQMPGVAGSLKEDLTIDEMDRRAGADSDTGAAIRMREAKQKLFAGFAQRKIA